MADIIDTLHPENAMGDNFYPNIKRENIPNGAVSEDKLDPTYLASLDARFNAIGDGSPKGVYATLDALQAAYPTGTSGIYIVSANGHWYYWNGSAWTDGGVYQATAIADGSITKEKIITGLVENITLENRLIDTFIINEKSVNAKVGLYNSYGGYEPGYTDYKCVEINVTDGNYLTWEQLQATSWIYLAYASADGTVQGYEDQQEGKKYLDLKEVKTLYINFFGDAYCADFKIVKNNATLKLNNKMIVNKNNLAYRPGIYFNFNGYNAAYTDHQCSYQLNCSNLKSVTFKSGGYVLPEVMWKDKNNNIYGSPTGQATVLTVDISNAVQIAFNFPDKKNVSYVISFKEDTNESLLNKYRHYNNKGFIFNNTKSALFVGDSITAGYTSGGSTTVNGYPKLFSDHYGMTYYNEAVGGAEYCEDGDYQGNLIPRMLTQITNSTHKNVNYLFIAGGINDWQNQNDLATFKQAVSDTLDYAVTNYPNAQIILITPINATTSFSATPKVNSIQKYRNIITETAMEKNNSRITVIQGNEFNFPDDTNNASFINQMFGDGLHPSEKGYATAYLYGLIGALS